MRMKENENTKSFHNLYKVGCWLAMTPFQREDNDSYAKDVFKRYYPVLCGAVFLTIMIMIAVTHITNLLENMKDITIGVIILLTDLSNNSFILITSLAVFVNRQSWMEFFEKLQILEQKLDIKEKKRSYCYYIYDYSIYLLTIFEVLCIGNMIIRRRDYGDCLQVALYFIQQCYKLFFVRFIYHFAAIFGQKYREIENILEGIQMKGHFTKAKTDNLMKKLSNVQVIYFETSELVIMFYSISKWSTFFVVVCEFIGTICTVNIAIFWFNLGAWLVVWTFSGGMNILVSTYFYRLYHICILYVRQNSY